MVGDDDDLVAVPDLGVLAEVLLEDADGARPADVVRHEDVDIDPDVVAGRDRVAAARRARIFSVRVIGMAADSGGYCQYTPRAFATDCSWDHSHTARRIPRKNRRQGTNMHHKCQ